MSGIAVRQAVFADLKEVAELFNQYREFQGKISDLAAARSFLAARFNHGESVIFIAHDESDPVGIAQLYPSYSSASLARIFILNDRPALPLWRPSSHHRHPLHAQGRRGATAQPTLPLAG